MVEYLKDLVFSHSFYLTACEESSCMTPPHMAHLGHCMPLLEAFPLSSKAGIVSIYSSLPLSSGDFKKYFASSTTWLLMETTIMKGQS